MLKTKKEEVISVFKKSINKYLSQEDLQEIIPSITYLYWNAKYVMKAKFNKELRNNNIDCILQFSNKDNQAFIYNVCNLCRMYITEANISNIVSYLECFDEEHIINIICDDYEKHSRYSSSTPEKVSELVIKILEQVKGTDVLDICSYTGNFLSQYAKKCSKYNYSGIEINKVDSILAKEKLLSLSVDSEIIEENVLKYRFNKRYDKVFCNHPFMISLMPEDYLAINNMPKKINAEFSKKISSDWAFVNNAINSIKENGKAVTIMPNGCLYKLTDQTIRKELVDNGFVEAVISLPGNIFNNTMVETSLLVLSYGNKKVKFVDASKMYTKETNKNIIDVESIFSEYLNKEENKTTKVLNIKEIEKMSYSLLANNYMAKEKVNINNPKVLSDVAEIFRGYQISASEIIQLAENKNGVEPCKIINITNINDGKIDKALNTIYPVDDKLNRYLLKDKDILVSSKGTINKFAIIEINNKEKYIASGNFNILRLKTEKVNPYYLKMFLESSKGTILLESIRSGGVLPALNMSLFKSMEIPVPSIEEQNEAVKKYLAKKDEIEILKIKLNSLEKDAQEIADRAF